MQIRAKKFLWLAIFLIVAGVVGWLLLGGKSSGEAEKYKAELRAKGEKLSFAELGFPKPAENGISLVRLTNAVSQIRRRSADASRFTNPNFTGPGLQRVIWQGEGIPVNQSTNRMGWDEFGTLVQSVTNELMEIRAAANQAVRWFLFNPDGYLTNFMGGTRHPFVDMRTAAQWLYADGIDAVRVGDLGRARQDHHALIQMAEFNREDPTLVAAMIRVAIAGLNLQFTWQVLQNGKWTDADLLAMQRDWERVDLLGAVETGFTGERAFTELAFAATRERGVGWMRQTMTPPRAPPGPWECMRDALVGMMWNADEDELVALRHHQGTLEGIRALRAGQVWPDVNAAFKRQFQILDRALSSKGINRFRFQLSAMVIANTSKAAQVAVRNETLRRLTITVIALKRFNLRHQRFPENLDELVPEFLAAKPIDPMNAEPLRYRRESDADFVIYSVGDDGKDDGGNPAPTAKMVQYDWWSGRDVVWPKPAD